MRAMQELGNLTPVRSFRVECPDLSRRSRFHDLYREGIMRELGQDFVVSLIDEARFSAGPARREEMLAKLTETLPRRRDSQGCNPTRRSKLRPTPTLALDFRESRCHGLILMIWDKLRI